MIDIPSLETARLWLRPIKLEDAEQVQTLFAQWDIVKYLTTQVPWPYPPDGTLCYYRDMAIPSMERGNAWHWTLRLKTAPEQILGGISLLKERDQNRGFWLGLPWHGQGLMTEACNRVTDYWFRDLGFPVLRVPKAVVNIASRRISERQGMRVVARSEQNYVSGRLETELWEITAEEWKAKDIRRPADGPEIRE